MNFDVATNDNKDLSKDIGNKEKSWEISMKCKYSRYIPRKLRF